MREGSMVAEAPVEELRGAAGLLLRAEPAERALEVAGALPGVERAYEDGGLVRVVAEAGRAAEVNDALVRAGVRVSELRPVERSLEEVFLSLTRENREDGDEDGG